LLLGSVIVRFELVFKVKSIVVVSVECRGEILLRESVDVPKVGAILVMPHYNVKPAGEIKPRHPFFVHGKVHYQP
jgi:hypothetical protein